MFIFSIVIILIITIVNIITMDKVSRIYVQKLCILSKYPTIFMIIISSERMQHYLSRFKSFINITQSKSSPSRFERTQPNPPGIGS